MSETNEAGPDEPQEWDALDKEAQDPAEQAWQDWLRSPADPDEWMKRVYDDAARAVDYLTAVCLGPRVREIEESWDLGGSEVPWSDAGPDSGEKSSSDEEGLPGEGRSAA